MEFDLDAARPALLVLDLQSLFTSAEGPFNNTGADHLISEVNAFTAHCQELGLPVIYSRYLLRDDLSDAGLLAANPIVRAGHFCESSPWMVLDERLQTASGATHLKRSRPGAFWDGALDKTLAQLQVDTLLLCGLSVNNAISTTAREAFARDIAPVVIRECTGAAPFEENMDQYFEILHTWTAEVAAAANVKQRLAK